jgi:hypothetical protein
VTSLPGLEAGDLVIVHCLAPKEKLWGVLLRLDPVGALLRGLDLATVDDWIVQERVQPAGAIAPSTVFIPMHRVERIYLDESSSVVESYGDRFRTTCGSDPVEALIRSPVQSGSEVQ